MGGRQKDKETQRDRKRVCVLVSGYVLINTGTLKCQKHFQTLDLELQTCEALNVGTGN